MDRAFCLLIVLASCRYHGKSSVTLVTDIRFSDDRIAVAECDLDHDRYYKTVIDPTAIVIGLLYPPALLGAEKKVEQTDLSVSGCGTRVLPLPPLSLREPTPLIPPECTDPIARYREARRALEATEAEASRQQCLQKRVAIARTAMAIADVKERARVYRSMPACIDPPTTTFPPTTAGDVLDRWNNVPQACRRFAGAPEGARS